MGSQESGEDEAMKLMGQAAIWNCLFGYIEGMALKCIVQLYIPDIINSHGCPLSLSAIVKTINHPSFNTNRLSRIMALLVRRDIFSAKPAVATEAEDNNTTLLYGLTNSSKWLIRDSKMSLAPMLLLQNHETFVSTFHQLADIVKEGGTGFAKCHGMEVWDFALANPEFNNLFNEAMAAASMIIVEAVKKGYKAGFNGIGSLVDVAGGTGAMIAEIVKEHPHIKGTNFDLPHVVATAPKYVGVNHVAGDMFTSIPSADALLLKWILHDWKDEDCIKILKNCRKAVPKKTGKLIVIDAVLCPKGNGLFDEMGFVLDLALMTQIDGKERDESEWEILLKEGGFGRYKIIKIPALASIIEAYPD
ncbi:o-methyltransferase, putative [Ricinus communis]|uniref:O-methyltransferase, putative n=1 Tax=Ricinus communis TaxID=3988 RepID=B9RGB0_RICCO|nr:o-methyltransferase, putative [Ricinus communis]|eukprot:XP_002513062.1 (R,S)-reticuline 7-O-methyltransferase [Ricinus communis]